MTPARGPSPPVVLRGRLAECRCQGMSFELAWSHSLRGLRIGNDAVTRRQWKAALIWARPEFEAAYYGQPTPMSESVAALVGWRPELPGPGEPDARVVEVAV